MYVVKKVYRVFDSLFFNRKDVQAILTRLEHKERAYVYYALLTNDAKESFLDGINHGIAANDAKLFTDRNEALKELKERFKK